MLLSEGLITQAQLDAALKAQAERGLPIGQLLVEDGAVTDAVLMGALARQLGLEFVDLAEYPIDRGSDIHVEPTETDLRIRFRVDGVLHEVMHSPRSIQGGVISRLKVMADINIAERRIPQDGRISLNVAGKPVDLRVATLPTVYGEKVVMRILDKTQARLSLADLGFHPAVLPRFEACFRKPYGTILV